MTSDDVRIGDTEREQAAQRLTVHVGSGRLDLAEYEQRVDAAYRARTRGELATVLADLPEQTSKPRAVPNAARPATGRVPAVAWSPWLRTAVICLAIWAATSLAAGQPLYFWPMWVIGPWGAVLAVGTLSGSAPSSRGGCRRAIAPHG
ncbi:MAG: DUF1707 domain-containing protein [Pseudonocardia sp.]|nr:DUF1707 domain-containing protein [Pseudonocardia sp.]